MTMLSEQLAGVSLLGRMCIGPAMEYLISLLNTVEGQLKATFGSNQPTTIALFEQVFVFNRYHIT